MRKRTRGSGDGWQGEGDVGRAGEYCRAGREGSYGLGFDGEEIKMNVTGSGVESGGF